MPNIADIYSYIDSLKRRGSDLIQNPGTSLQQMVGYANDRAGQYNQALSEAAKERGYGPNTQALAQQMAEGYSPGGMTVWHGSPYKFTKFDPAKIGTGEGAQAYGHGLYVAENPKVGKDYQEKLSQDYFDVSGQLFDPFTLKHRNVRALVNRGKLDEAINKAMEVTYGNSPVSHLAAEDLSVLKDIKSKGGLKPYEGSLYKIDLPDEHIGKMLDWDKPLSQQPENVQKAAQEFGITKTPSGMKEARGSDIYTGISNVLQKPPYNNNTKHPGSKEGSEYLSNLGIPGIKYLDEYSRDEGQGTRNFVIFPGNEHLLDIQDINGNPTNN